MEKYNRILSTLPRFFEKVGMPSGWARVLGHISVLAIAASAPLVSQYVDLSQLVDVLGSL